MEKIECPVCSKEFPLLVIEEHVSRCLFLSEPSQVLQESHGVQKRPASKEKNNSPVLKKSKSEYKKCGNLQNKFSSSNPSNSENNVEEISINMNSKNEGHHHQKDVAGSKAHLPLAERMRPSSLTTYVGQEHILGPQCLLHQLLNKAEIPNIILWGPPGCGKTSLANVIAGICRNEKQKLRYVKLSAASSGVNDVKEAVSLAANELRFGRRTVMFMDEIHRFNKLQQDIFLPHVESGKITLIGATTENPSFSLNSALLSRCRVIVLEKLSTQNVVVILKNAVKFLKGHDTSHEGVNSEFLIDYATLEWLAETCDGDARIALGGLELAIQSKVSGENESLSTSQCVITLNDVKESLKKTHMLYDRKGDQHYDIISALHKSLRASDENASIYWLARMMSGGEDPVYIARRLVRFASEDIGLEDTNALSVAVNTMHACKMIGMPECDVLLAQCVVYLARAPKSRLMEDVLRAAQKIIAEHKGPQPSVPLVLRNAPTRLMEKLGHGAGYNMQHKDYSGLTYLPEGLEHINFFNIKP
ncbi:ATPase WRNIP1-like [Leptopilina boulardi]|uniref:ATPase WRNIP1-like n=1 Tax=Leptopilina boulardi TaxID=63433 RepID=UPI0021F52DDD|nr:ATPase WRNIP1-like [Leptopilina boulardi]XP_051158351.1 ATPase WRNIP1-like [Leptopilina boulardi]XP_051158352.1 ATPase WRNIP1-like [Leptopilina boulardi]